ncbi:putative signal peptide and transmembrane protein [Rhodopirellula islandica]|uniref:Signal peptide and transmembrane protein n=1 Tax=Rhodopirellula islandica TaxID=595434 RepID=A0A0J1EIS0_RHOIS|nr:putative signal peptide and transmembrane protein [Rhodopirellula islandica]
MIGNPTTEVLYGNDSPNSEMRNGVRLSIGRPISDRWNFYGEGLYVGDAGDPFRQFSSGQPILARPYVSAQTGLNDSELVAFPNVLEGAISVETESRLFGFEIGASSVFSEDKDTRISIFTGYRFIQFEDSLGVQEDLESIDLGGVVPLGTTFRVNDSFEAKNQFHGVNLRLEIEKQLNRWDLVFQPSLALGSMERTVSTAGTTRTQIPGLDPTFVDGGLLAQPTNIGQDTSSVFTVLPEFRFSLGREVLSGLRFDVGYSFLLLPKTFRAAEQIDPNLNASQIGGGALVGPGAPAVARNESHLWNQSITFSVALQR